MAAAHWMADAVKNKGSLRATAMRKGLLSKESDTLSASDLRKLAASSNPLTAKRARLAETFARTRK